MGLNILLTGVTGYVGSVLAPRLLRDGHSVRGFARDPSRARLEEVPVLAGDAVSGEGLAQALEGVVIELLAGAATNQEVCGQSLDAVGPDLVTYGELIDRIREHMLVSRPTIGFNRLTVTPIASRISALIAGEDHSLIGPLMESLDEDLLPRDDRAARLLGVRLHSLDAAIEHALGEWEAAEPLAAR